MSTYLTKFNKLFIKVLIMVMVMVVVIVTESPLMEKNTSSASGTVIYSTIQPTNGNVTATVTIDSSYVGSRTYLFTSNGTHTFIFSKQMDGVNYTTPVIATVSWIDKTAPSVLAVTLASNNDNQARAKAGDIVTLTFTTTEEVQTPTVTIAGNAATVSDGGDGDARTWKARYVMKEGDSEGIIAFTLDFKDLVGNIATRVRSTTNMSSVKYDQTPPTGTVSYSPTGPTNGNVTASVNMDSDTTITNNAGSTTYEFS